MISWVGIQQVRDFEKERVEKIEAQVRIAEGEVSRINGINGQLQGFIGDFNQAAKYLDARNQIGVLMEKLQSVLPPGKMWLISLEPCQEEEEDYGDDSESGASAAAANTPARGPLDIESQLEFSNLQEVKKIRLVGYVLTAGNKEGGEVLTQFEDAVKALEYFEGIEFKQNKPHGDSNLFYFEVILTLKDPLKK